MNIYKPPTYLKDDDFPLIFLAGPIQGTDDWQKRATEIILKNKRIIIADPRRDIGFEKDFGEELYQEQVDWETYHLNRAAQKGVILFWLANEKQHDCTRSYAQTTRFELAEWINKHKYFGAKIVIGIDTNFSGSRYIKHRLSRNYPDIPISFTLEETCDKAVKLLVNSKEL